MTAWLAALAVDAEQLAVSLGDTITPGPRTDDATTAQSARRPDSGALALELLHELAGASPTSTAQLRVGDVIAEGGMGVIRTGYQVGLGRSVAVKTLRPDRRSQRSELDLLREAWITGTVEHPNVVPVHYVGLDDERQPVIVLKRIEGVEWSELIAAGDVVHDRFGTSDLRAT